MNERWRVKPHEKDIICFSEVRVEPSHPRKRLVASRSVASAFTSEQQRRSATFFGKEEQRNERAGDFCKKIAASDMKLAATWSARRDSNPRPSESESDTLSS